jgi:alkanesulfonate monooxygenase SsuD/methylene tetrahydromethanopterin reductase-like flavin-dependent oxidoreductase (luciferase family)
VTLKIEFFQTMNYHGPLDIDSWPAPPRACESDWAKQTYEHSLDECAAALEAGFDSLNFAEHHYSPKQLTPNPVVLAALAGQRFKDAQIGVFGTDLPLNNPVRIAEEYSMLDNLLDGRLRIAMLRGTPNEYLTYGSNPWESRERYEEGTLLVQACFVEPEPFGWEGRYYRYRNIAVWPRRVQDPHPRILISGNSKDGAIFAGKHGFDLGFSYMEPEKCAVHADIYRETARDNGWEPTADNIQYRHFMFVAPTDADVAEARPAFEGKGLLSLFAGATPDTMLTMMQIGAALGGVPKHVEIEPGMAPRLVPAPAFYGSPDTVNAQIAEAFRVLGMGRLEISVGGVNPLAHDTMLSTLKLIGEEVVPVVHEEAW